MMKNRVWLLLRRSGFVKNYVWNPKSARTVIIAKKRRILGLFMRSSALHDRTEHISYAADRNDRRGAVAMTQLAT